LQADVSAKVWGIVIIGHSLVLVKRRGLSFGAVLFNLLSVIPHRSHFVVVLKIRILNKVLLHHARVRHTRNVVRFHS